MGSAETKLDWRCAVAQKQRELAKRTPKEWMLNEDFIQSLDCGPTKATNLLQLKVPRTSGLLTEKELGITEKNSAVQLLQKLRIGELTALEVTRAFCKRAVIAQQLLSCLTEVFYATALEDAKELDQYYQATGTVRGPLHGLPVSIKDSFCVKGIQSTVGWTSLLASPPAEHESALVSMLRGMGAILYAKTNIPQTMMTGDSENNIYGRTLNPHNTSLTAGGSSGGEGALVAFRGSILGVGTDIAGSIRIPALCCGVYGFKPTTNRVPYGGQVSGPMAGLPGVVASAGPLAHNLEDVELFLSNILSNSPEDLDSTAAAVPWRNVESPKQMRIGVLPEEKVFPLQPPIRRVLKTAVKALQAAGHEIIHLPEITDCSVSLANRIAFEYYTLGPDMWAAHFGPEGEPMVTSVAARYNPMFAGPFPVAMELEPYEKIDQLYNAQKAYGEAWRKYWMEHKLDVLLAPAAQNTAVPHDTYGWPPYTQIWNLLDYPACVIPYQTASKIEDPKPVEEDEFGPQPKYNAEAVHGMPCAVQVITRRFRDEECLAAAKAIDQALKTYTGS